MKQQVNPIQAFLSYLALLLIFPITLATILSIAYNAQITLLQVELQENKYE